MATKKATSSRQILHERKAGKHRIVIINGPTQMVGGWANDGELAELAGYVANSDMDWRGCPVGVFKITNIAHQVLQ